MANSHANEIGLFKGIACKLNDDTVITLAYFAHTEKHAKNKSCYMYSGRIDKLDDLNNYLAELKDHPSAKWSWKNMKLYDTVTYGKHFDDTNERAYKWLSTRLRKAVDWDTFVNVLNGIKNGKKSDNAKYKIDNYVASDGTVIEDITQAKDKLIALVGQTIESYIKKPVIEGMIEVKAEEHVEVPEPEEAKPIIAEKVEQTDSCDVYISDDIAELIK